MALVVVVFTVSFGGSPASDRTRASAIVLESDSAPVDSVSASDIAINLSRMSNMDTALAVAFSAEERTDQLAVSTNDNIDSVEKPQVIETSLKSRHDITKYKVKAGDTLSSIARKHGVTSNSIRWSNSLNSDRVEVGKELNIPPVNGIVYKVKADDTIEDLASIYDVDEARLVAFNDAEVGGLPTGELIVLPDGEMPAPAARSVAPSRYVYGGGYASTSSFPRTGYAVIERSTMSYNGYYGGWCTAWAAKRAAQLGNPVRSQWGNANRWATSARRAGYRVSSAPRVGAVMQTNAGWYGHVGVVEEVSADGTKIKYSDMNGLAGWGVAARTNNWVSASGYSYIYR